ncbi:MAG: S1C family serine protease [Alphaproteobacteria bacterium]
MSDASDREIDPALQPRPQDVDYDLDRALSAVVALRSRIPEDGMTASLLGTERAGHGVLIRDNGLVVTIGYLITEAESVWLVDNNGAAVQAHVVGYDQETGFGLVQALGRLSVPAIEIGRSSELRAGDSVILAGSGGRSQATKGRISAKREFAGYWEYVLDEAIFTVPAHPFWGGSGLIDPRGRLAGIGSLYVQQATGGREEVAGNMVVPIDLLGTVIDDLLQYGRTRKPPRPWLGMMATEIEDKLVVAGLVNGGPALSSNLRAGDILMAVNGQPVGDLADLFRKIWAMGEAGVTVPLTILRDGTEMNLRIPSVSRAALLRGPQLH